MNIYILTFIITALYDVVLRYLSLNYERLPSFVQYDFVVILKKYFKKHTTLAAALIAGFVGATSQVLILALHKLPNSLQTLLSFLLVSFVVSALYGFIMKFSKLFPHLDNTYYKELGILRSLYHDGISGLIVQITLLTIIYGERRYFRTN